MYGRRPYPLLLKRADIMSRKRSFFDKRIVVCGALCALAVIMLYFGAIIEVMDLSMGAIASLVIVLIVIEMGYSYAWISYAAISILSFILLPQKLTAVIFAALMGFYPIVKSYIEKINSSAVGWCLKLIVANVAFFGIFLVMKYFMPDQLETETMMLALYALANVAFVLYDYAVSKLITAYFYKLRERIRIYKLLK